MQSWFIKQLTDEWLLTAITIASCMRLCIAALVRMHAGDTKKGKIYIWFSFHSCNCPINILRNSVCLKSASQGDCVLCANCILLALIFVNSITYSEASYSPTCMQQQDFNQSISCTPLLTYSYFCWHLWQNNLTINKYYISGKANHGKSLSFSKIGNSFVLLSPYVCRLFGSRNPELLIFKFFFVVVGSGLIGHWGECGVRLGCDFFFVCLDFLLYSVDEKWK